MSRTYEDDDATFNADAYTVSGTTTVERPSSPICIERAAPDMFRTYRRDGSGSTLFASPDHLDTIYGAPYFYEGAGE